MGGRLTALWNRERLGLTMILASVAVIAVTIFLSLNLRNNEQVENLRSKGASISRILADVPFSELRSRQQDHSPLRMLQLGQDSDEFAYAVVVNDEGLVLNAVNSPAVDVTSVVSGVASESWFGEREVTVPANGRRVLEFFAPALDEEEVVGSVRVGYFLPTMGLAPGQVPFIASIALTIFLLTPLFYFMVRREIRPIHAVNDEIASRMSNGQFNTCTIEATGELREFIDRFNGFMELARGKVEALERDNTEMVAAQKLLGYRKLRIEAVLKAIPEAILILGEDGSVSYANDMVKSLLLVEPGDILHKTPSEWCLHEEALDFLTRFEKPSTSNFYSETLRLTSPADAQRKLSIKAYPLFSPQDPEMIFGRLVILRDVTREALAEEGRGNFIAHVSHELKTPLNTLALYAEALQGGQGEDESFRIDAYNVINDEVERLGSLVDNLLSITKIEMGNLKIDKERVRLHDLLRDAFKHVAHSGKDKNLDFQLDVPAELSTVAADKDLLRIAINNIVGNAIKYTPAGGRVALTAEETDSAFEIRVTDTGIGIAPEDSDKIFEKFYRSESDEVRAIAGHGLGLPLAKEIIELHRGQLSVASEPGKGSEFLIRLWKDRALLKQAV